MKKYKLKKKNILLIFIFLIFSFLLIYSAFNIYKWLIDSKKIDEEIKIIEDVVKPVVVVDNEQTEIINEEVKEESDPYWDYIKMDMLDVNFDELLKINNETKGWISVNGTNINYPFVQASDNDYYLTHSFDKSYNGGGWVFLDYRNKIMNNKNMIIYAHGRENKTMFGTLKNILNSSWVNNKDNYIVKLSTESENTLWQVFSVYRIPNTNDYIKTEFASDESFAKFVNMLLDRSNFDFNTSIDKNDQILTLSTCYNDYEKVVLHAKLIKKMTK